MIRINESQPPGFLHALHCAPHNGSHRKLCGLTPPVPPVQGLTVWVSGSSLLIGNHKSCELMLQLWRFGAKDDVSIIYQQTTGKQYHISWTFCRYMFVLNAFLVVGRWYSNCYQHTHKTLFALKIKKCAPMLVSVLFPCPQTCTS